MIKERGVFSNRYLTRSSKQNLQNQNNKCHKNQIEQPSNYVSAKSFQERPSLSIRKKKQKVAQEAKSQQMAKLERQVKEAKNQLRKNNKEMLQRTNLYDIQLKQFQRQIKEKDLIIKEKEIAIRDKEGIIGQQKIMINGLSKKLSQQSTSASRYRETIKKQIFWLAHLFSRISSNKLVMSDLLNQVHEIFSQYEPYISELQIKQQLQSLAQASSLQSQLPYSSIAQFSRQPLRSSGIGSWVDPSRPVDSMFTEDLQQHNNVLKMMDVQPLIETFSNLQCYEPQSETSIIKMERITKKLFEDSPLFKDQEKICVYQSVLEPSYLNVYASKEEKNEFLPQQQNFYQKQEKRDDKRKQNRQNENKNEKQLDLPIQVKIIQDFVPDSSQQNYIGLTSGSQLKLLRKIRPGLWIGEFNQKIGLVNQMHFQMPAF